MTFVIYMGELKAYVILKFIRISIFALLYFSDQVILTGLMNAFLKMKIDMDLLLLENHI